MRSLPLLVAACLLAMHLASPAAGVPILAPPQDFRSAENELLARMAGEGTNVTLLYQAADVCHDAGVAGDKPAVQRAEAYLDRLLAMVPTNAPALALRGSVETLKGRDAFWPTTQLRLVRRGIDLMDRAVRLDPDDIPTRLIRALNNAHMPEFLGREETVRADLEWLWERIEKNPAPFNPNQIQQVALHWGVRLKRSGRAEDARRIWEKGRAVAVNSPVAVEIAAELAKLK